MNAKSTPTSGDYGEYLVRVYFGLDANKDYLKACIDRAYRDFNRTLRGLSKLKSKDELHAKAVGVLRGALDGLRALCSDGINNTEFDDWHRTTCENLCSTYEEHGFKFHVGQAQKWINMSLKYIFVLGEARVGGFGKAYQFCHVPLDDRLLKRLGESCDLSKLRPWSQIDDYPRYLDCQRWIRTKFKPLPPLGAEFKLWLGEKVP